MCVAVASPHLRNNKSMATVSLRNLTKSFGDIEVIKGVSIEVAHGEFVALVGPSGCGKSTLIRLIAGLEDVSGGTIDIGGRCVNEVPAKLRDIAMVFQNYALYPHMTVAENMAFSLKMQKVAKAEIARRVAETAASLNLTELLGRYPRQLSGGQQQRVATGRAIVRSPQIFLFDEPLSNLDAKLRVQVRAELRQLHRQLGVTSIYVTHDQIEAMTMADRIIVMRDGRIEQAGEPLDLYDRPANVFVATFIGSPAMNLITGRILDGRFVLADGATFAVHPAIAASVMGPITIGLRPDHIDIGHEATAGVAATLIAYEPTGSETIVNVELAAQPITITTRTRLSLTLGSPIRITPTLAQQHYFDVNGARIAVE